MKLNAPRIAAFAAALCLPLLPPVAAPAADDKAPADAEAATKTADAKNSEKQAGQRIISLVLLQNAPRKLSHGEIAHAVEEGAGVKISTDDVITREGYHFVPIGDEKYIVNDIAEAYFAEADELAAELDAPDLAAAIKACTAWVSVDWSGNNDEADLKHVYQHIATTIAHLSNRDTLAVYSPDMDAFALWTPATRKVLESDDPLAIFGSAAAPQADAAK